MNRYRVTYIESTLRERFITANSPDEAEESVRAEFDTGQHHHMVDSWNDDWQAAPDRKKPDVRRPCAECGQ